MTENVNSNLEIAQLKKQSDIVLMTPLMASEFLANQRENRPVKKTNLFKLMNDIENGLWMYNGDAIRFDRNGKMCDGQHRCLACIKTGKAIVVRIERNIPDEAFTTIDKGVTRTSADDFRFLGVSRANAVASCIKTYVGVREGAVNNDGKGNFIASTGIKRGTPSSTIIRNIYLEDTEFWNTIVAFACQKYETKRYLNKSIIGGLVAYLIKDKHHPQEKVLDFFTQIMNKRDSESIVINLLRDKLQDYYDRRKTVKFSGTMAMGLIAKTWNAFLTGKTYKMLRYNRDIEGIIPFI